MNMRAAEVGFVDETMTDVFEFGPMERRNCLGDMLGWQHWRG